MIKDVAYFMFFAWGIQALEYLGLIETEASDPVSQAYRAAHQCLQALKDDLVGAAVLSVEPEEVLLCHPGKGEFRIFSRNGQVKRVQGSEDLLLAELGAEGSLKFDNREHVLGVTVLAVMDEGAKHELTFSVPKKARDVPCCPTPSESEMVSSGRA